MDTFVIQYRVWIVCIPQGQSLAEQQREGKGGVIIYTIELSRESSDIFLINGSLMIVL